MRNLKERVQRVRPADIFLPNGVPTNSHTKILIDVGFSNPIQAAYIYEAASVKGIAAKKVEDRKHKKYDQYLEGENLDFIVAAIESTGRWGLECSKFITFVIGQVAHNRQDSFSITAADFWQSSAKLLQETNAKAIYDRSPINDILNPY